MPDCPICGLGERCRNHWVATEDASGEIAFQTGVMTASEDNLVLLRNKLKNPPLRQLFERIGLEPTWVEASPRRLAYLDWPLDLRGAVHRTLFPNGAPGAPPLDPAADRITLIDDRLEEVNLARTGLDLENCLPDELLYLVDFALDLAQAGRVEFRYVGLLWAEGTEWTRLLDRPARIAQAANLVQLMLADIVNPLRESFAGRPVQLLAENAAGAIPAGTRVDEIIVSGDAGGSERHFGEQVEAAIHARRLQPLLRDCLLQFSASLPLTQ